MQRDVVELLADATREALEISFFAQAAQVEEIPLADESAIAVSIKAGGFLKGEFQLAASSSAALALCAACLAEEPANVTRELATWTVLELANIVCGSMLSRYHPAGPLLVTPPEVSQAREPGSVLAARAAFQVEEGRLWCWFEPLARTADHRDEAHG